MRSVAQAPSPATLRFDAEQETHHSIRWFPGTRSKWRSRLNKGSECCRQSAEIHRSFVGMGLPRRFSSRLCGAGALARDLRRRPHLMFRYHIQLSWTFLRLTDTEAYFYRSEGTRPTLECRTAKDSF